MTTSPTSRRGRLLLSIHDVAPCHEGAVDRLRDLLGAHGSPETVTLLVVPDYWGRSPLVPGSGFATRLRAWADRGAEILLHGWFHRDDSPHAGRLARFKAKRMTAGEGEFLGLDHAEATRRLRRGRALLRDVLGREVSGFVAPAWLYGDPARAALAETGFTLAEDHLRVWRPDTGAIVARGPVLTWASRSRARIASSLFAARALAPILARLPVARLGVHPGDTSEPALLRSIDRAAGRLVATHRPARYADLLDG